MIFIDQIMSLKLCFHYLRSYTRVKWEGYDDFSKTRFLFLSIFEENGEGRVGFLRLKRSTPLALERARMLRREQTPAEARLWSRLRDHQLNGIGFRRQHAIGPYIADFCAPKYKLIIELDGSQHLDQKEYDTQRTKFLEDQKYQILRYWNNDVMNNIENVTQDIILALNKLGK
jgi:very-short-patch-repair endonuclease